MCVWIFKKKLVVHRHQQQNRSHKLAPFHMEFKKGNEKPGKR